MGFLCERMRSLREDRDLSQKDIAAVLNTTQQVYSRYENGNNEVPIHHLITLSRFYNVSIDYIVGETDVKDRYK
ncbi:MAG: helix-turn-helix transcriptional regulator [Clostridia bacterium]|nr:helix-turn-helix transcriptional regulator [Clostridia bacterium]